MNSNQNGKTIEDTPEYRSIMIRPLTAPPQPRSFASLRPVKTQPRVETKEPSITSATWKVSNLPALSAFYILERTNVYVESSSQEVANRICNCLRLESIATTFDEEDKVRTKRGTFSPMLAPHLKYDLTRCFYLLSLELASCRNKRMSQVRCSFVC